MFGIKHVFVVLPAPSSTSTHPKFILGAVWKQTLKGKWHLKSRNPRSYHPKLKLQVFEKKQQKEKWDEKRRNPRSYHSKFSLAGFWIESRERKRRWEKYRKVGIQDRASKVHNWRFLNGKLCLKGRVHEKSRNSWSYHPKFILAAVWKGNLEGKWKETNWNARSYHPKFIIEGFWMENCDRKRTWEKQESNFERNMAWEKLESTILPSKVHNYRFLKGKVWKEKEMKKVGIYVYDLTIQSSFFAAVWKGKFERKK